MLPRADDTVGVVPPARPALTNPAQAPTPPARRSSSTWVKRARKVVRQLRRAARHEVHAYYRRQSIQSNVVFYESFAGNRMLCNTEAVFRALLADPEFAHLTHVWALRS